MTFQTEVPFALPRGYVDADGTLHTQGVMRLATAYDEIAPMKDPRVQSNPGYLVIILLSWSNADRRTRDLTRQALDDVVTVLKADWPGKRIEVAPLGYTPVPP